MNLSFYSYRFAEEVLGSPAYQLLRDDILDILRSTPVPRLAVPKTRTRAGRTMVFTADSGALNKQLETEFQSRNWDLYPWIVADKGTQLKADYKKGRVQVEIQLGNMARAIYDVFKLQVSYSQDLIDVGIVALPIQALAKDIDENIAHFERLVRELKYAKMSITLPIWVIGLEP